MEKWRLKNLRWSFFGRKGRTGYEGMETKEPKKGFLWQERENRV